MHNNFIRQLALVLLIVGLGVTLPHSQTATAQETLLGKIYWTGFGVEKISRAIGEDAAANAEADVNADGIIDDNDLNEVITELGSPAGE